MADVRLLSVQCLGRMPCALLNSSDDGAVGPCTIFVKERSLSSDGTDDYVLSEVDTAQYVLVYKDISVLRGGP